MADPGLLKAFGSTIEFFGALAEGEAADERSKLLQEQYNQRANLEAGAAQAQAARERRRGEYVQSRAIALAAASGAGGVGVDRILADIEAETDYRVSTALWEGEVAEQDLKFQGAVVREQGRAAKRASYLDAAGALVSAGTSLHEKYGMFDKPEGKQ